MLKDSVYQCESTIDDKAKETAKEKEQKAFDDKLRLLELQSQGLYAGTTAYFDNRQSLLDTAMAKELAAVEKGGAEEIAIKSKYAKLQKQLDNENHMFYIFSQGNEEEFQFLKKDDLNLVVFFFLKFILK